MLNTWRKIPIVRLLLPFSAGIIVQNYLWIPLNTLLPGGAFLLLLLSLLTLWPVLRNNAKLLFNSVLHVLLFCLGATLTFLNTEALHPAHFSNFDRIEVVDGVVTTDPEEATNSFKTTVEARAVIANGEKHQTSGEFLLYLSKKADLTWKKGDRIFVARAPQPIDPPKNPGEFDYRQYLFRHGITHQLYLRDPSEARIIQPNFESSYTKFFDESRIWLLARLREAVKDDDAFAVSSALILGQKEFLSPQIRATYAGTGAMHVLAVSGLHVGIIYLILMGCLKWLGSHKWSSLIKLLFILIGLWSYAILTGLSPSVLRASTMFSAVAIAQNIGRQTNIYNTLAAAALALLCYNPYLLFEVGFQLSFLAVLGIVLIQPLIYHQVMFRNKLADKIWQLTSVSIAAQIATFPLGILYFNQFPNYFLLSNFIVIPSAFVILVLGIFLMLFAWLQPVFEIIGNLLNLVVYVMNFLVASIESLPHAVTTGLFINLIEGFVIYSLIAFLILAAYQKHVRYIIGALGMMLILLASYTWRLVDRHTNPVVAVNHIYGSTCLNFIDSHQNIIVADSTFLMDEKKQTFHLKNFWYSRGFSSANKVDIQKDSLFTLPGFKKIGAYISFHGFQVRIAEDEDLDKYEPNAPPVDLLVLGGYSKVQNRPMAERIALSSSYRYKSLCCDSLVSVEDVRQTGAIHIACNEKDSAPKEYYLGEVLSP